jgi:heme-degrading monooxygenase HmoA
VASPNVSAESPILLDIWTVDPSRRDELIAKIASTVQSVAMRQPGFVSAQLYQGVDRGIVLLSVNMRTVKDRQHLMDSPESHTAMRELRTIATSHTHLFELVGSFEGAASSDLESS